MINLADRGNLPDRIYVTIKTTTGNKFSLEVSKNDTIIDIKKKIHEKIGLILDEQILWYQDKILKDGKTVDEYQIVEKSVITVWDISTDSMVTYLCLRTRGICLVISNETFTSNTYNPRHGTEIDEDNIKKTFEEMNYKVKIHRNVPNFDMDRVIDETKAAVESNHTMLIVFIMSHGTEEGIITVDEAIIPFRNILKPFSNELFPKLSGKPKLFFFVCSQGSNINIAVSAVSAVSGSEVEHDGPSATAALCPAMADFFIGYATCESYVTLRTPAKGTHYVDCLCRVIRDHPRWSIADIHQEVQSVLSRELRQGTHFQMPHFDSRLRDHSYLCDNN